jgi:hypothetical protein
VSPYGVVLFHTSSAAFRAEKLLRGHSVPVKLIPTPRALSSDCGTALRFAWNDAGRVGRLLADGRVDVAGIHPL